MNFYIAKNFYVLGFTKTSSVNKKGTAHSAKYCNKEISGTAHSATYCNKEL